MRLTQDTIRKLIKEQLQENQADRDALFSRMIDLISDIESAGLNYTSVYNDAKQAHVERKSQAREKMATTANRDDEMTEKLGKDATPGEYVDDFRKSKAPQFKGKSKKKKQQMAIAAYLDAQDDK